MRFVKQINAKTEKDRYDIVLAAYSDDDEESEPVYYKDIGVFSLVHPRSMEITRVKQFGSIYVDMTLELGEYQLTIKMEKVTSDASI